MRYVLSMLGLLFVLSSGMVSADEGQAGFAWKDMRAACKGNHESSECLEYREKARDYCQAHPNKKRCRKLHAMKECKQNPGSEKCHEYKERIKAYCDEHPGSKKCVRARLHQTCKDDPESEECLTAKEKAHHHFCEKHPDHDKCI
ncbi:MAG: hypothetical protein R8G33_07715 [Gammaproteobacteria bacterium]|nr:hypothetical protein [Gammaproteobacteria bacterium]